MSAFNVGEGERVLFAFTHPDDELAVAAFLARLAESGVPVRVFWTHSTPVRKNESLAAMRVLGIDEPALTFFDTPDGRVVEEVSALRGPVSRIVEEFQPTRVVTHAFEQGHIDHDATNLLVNLCFSGNVYEAPFYHTYLTKYPRLYRFSTPGGEETMMLTSHERKMKKRLVCLYPSQTIRRNVLLYELAHTMTMRRPPLFLYERLRLQTHKDFLRPNHPPAIAKRIEASRTWKRWCDAVKALL